MEELQGQVERITYASERTGYTIARLKVRGRPDLVTVVGGLMAPPPGAVVRVTGRWKTHPKYGEQFEAVTCDTLTPATVLGIRKYLGSGLVKGVGPRIAERIVKAFGERTLDIIETDIGRLATWRAWAKSASSSSVGPGRNRRKSGKSWSSFRDTA